MSMWQRLPMSERMAAAQAVAADRKINERAVEKDWWVTVELEESIRRSGVQGFKVENVTMTPTADGMKPIDADSDPTVIMVSYDSIFPAYEGDIVPRVKVEISCLSMSEPYEEQEIRTLIHDSFKDVDEDLVTMVKTVKPSRTFLEKAFLLNEEFQKENPRSRRMSRHLYDLERLMDTDYGREALGDAELYRAIVEHRRKFYHLGYVDYDRDYPEAIDFVPKGEVLEAYRRDYMENMVNGYIYGDAMGFEDLMKRMQELQERFRRMKVERVERS